MIKNYLTQFITIESDISGIPSTLTSYLQNCIRWSQESRDNQPELGQIKPERL